MDAQGLQVGQASSLLSTKCHRYSTQHGHLYLAAPSRSLCDYYQHTSLKAQLKTTKGH